MAEAALAVQPNDKREIRGWAMYDWAISAFSTTVGTVFLGPYLASLATTVAKAEFLARHGVEWSEQTKTLSSLTASFFGIPIAPDSYLPYAVSLSVGLQVLFLPILGAIADYSHLRKRMMQTFALIGSLSTIAMFFITAATWQLGGILFVIANLAFGAAMVFYNAYLPDIATEDKRDSVSSFGWAMGYLGGGLLLVFNIAFYLMRDKLGVDGGLAARINLASAGVWWFGFSLITFATLRSRHAVKPLPAGESYLTIGFKQLWKTFGQASQYPHTIRFLLAYLLYNDGIQTVIAVASVFAAAEVARGGLGLETGTLSAVILMIQFVAFGGALAFGWLAGRIGGRNALVGGLVVWAGVVIYAYAGMKSDAPILGMPQREFEFWLLGACIALVMGGTQAISRSIFAQMIPTGKEAEFFAIYEVSERGTSWTGPLVFGLVNQWLGNMRPAILSLIFYFVVGLGLLIFIVDVPRAIRESKAFAEG